MSDARMRVCWVLVSLAVLSAACDNSLLKTPVVKSPFGCEDTWPPSPALRDIPTEWDAAVMRIVTCLRPDEYKVINGESEATYEAWSHDRLALVLRNEWIHPEGSPLTASLRSLGLEYSEDMVAALLSAAWHWVHGQRMDVKARIACLSAWNAEMQRLGRTTPLGRPIPDPPFTCQDDAAVEAAKPHWESVVR